jgi:hypothetical protein
VALRLYLDDCAFKHSLRARLVDAGHEVVVPVDAEPDLTGADDEEHLAYAARNGLILVTRNPPDFLALHDAYQAEGRTHAGIFLIYSDNNVKKDMSDGAIGNAVDRVEALYGAAGIANGYFVLNWFR